MITKVSITHGCPGLIARRGSVSSFVITLASKTDHQETAMVVFCSGKNFPGHSEERD